MLITKAINFHPKREQIPNCLPFEIFLILRFCKFSQKNVFLSASAVGVQ